MVNQEWYYVIAAVAGVLGGGTAHPAAKKVKAKVRPKPPTVMYDSVSVDQIPPNAQAVLGYVDGYWPTYPTLLDRFPKAKVLGLTVDHERDADGCDCELGDLTPAQTVVWTLRALSRKVARPVVYLSASGVEELLAELAHAGVHRTAIRVLSAHYTGKAHICSPATCGYPEADGTQWTSKALGRNLDCSQLSASFWT